MFRFPPLCLALLLALPGAALAQAQTNAQQPAPTVLVQFDLPAQPLEAAINALARQANVSVAVNLPLVRGKQAAALSGRFSVQEGFDRLLRGSGLQAQVRGAIVTIRRQPGNDTRVSTLMPVTVRGRPSPRAEIFATPDMRSVVTKEDLQRLPPRNASDILGNVSGVFTSQGRSDPGLSVNIWGMQDFGRVNVMIDGTRQNFQRSGHGTNGQVYLDPALIGGVDISKGPSSTLGGAGMIAGKVDFRTLEIHDIVRDGQQTGGRVQATTGSNAYHLQSSAAIGHRFSDKADIVAAVSRRNIGAFKLGSRNGVPLDPNKDDSIPVDEPTQTTWQDTWSGLVKLGWTPSADHRVQLSYLGMDTRFANSGMTAESSAPLDEGRYKVRTDTLKLGYDYHPDSPWIDLASTLYYTSTRRSEARMVSDQTAGGAFALQFETHTVGGTLENTATLQRGDWTVTARTGGEFFHDWTRPQYNDHVDSDTRDPAWYVGSTPEGKRTVASLFQDVALEYQDWLRIGVGARIDKFWLSGNGQMYIDSIRNEQGVRPPVTSLYTNFEVERSAWDWAPTLSLAVKPVSWLQVFANYGEGLRPPALTETLMYGMHVNNMFPYYPSPGLKEERSRAWQFGVNLNMDNVLQTQDALRVKAAWFDNRVRNYIVGSAIMSPVAVADCTGIMCPNAYVNLREPARFRGLDIQVDYESPRVFANLNLTRVLSHLNPYDYNPFPLGSWTGYPDSKLGNGQAGTYLSDIFFSSPPTLKLGISGGLRFLDSTVEVGARWRYEKPATEYSLTRKHVRTVRLWDAWASWQVNRSLRIGLAVDNLLNENYVELAGSGGGMSYGPGRTVLGTLTWQF